ncbi:RNA-binding protein 42 [Plodia interpunctella]|uniref:RNA-binding protein 42 n=1 Tax=Plodia interpunctella TaxID=58824 RepID=UPI002368F2F0|nr:RNA-binding protein 42 [Plodia interpunctella]XP_053612247.1 RNA-binding protein 42 [Plodia interpunctella]
MEDSSKFQQMQDEMSRFEAEISGGEIPGIMRPVIGAGTFGAVQQQLERALPPPPPPPTMLAMEGMFAPRMMFPSVPPPPPPPSMMVPASVQRLRGPCPDGFPGGMPFMRPAMPGPQLIPPPPPKPQPVILSAAPKLYKQPKDDEEKKEKHEKKKKKRPRSPPPRPPPASPPPPPAPAPQPLPVTITTTTETVAPKVKKEKKSRKVVRTAGGQVWEDVSLLEWPDDDFRMFCGDLGNDVTDELLTRTFSKYTSFQRAKVIRDKRTNKSKGFGFVSFKDPGDFIKAMKEMDGRYVGSRPIKLRKSSWKNRSLDVVRKKEKERAALLSLLMSQNKS